MTISPATTSKGAWDTSVRVDALGKQVGFFHEHKKGVDRVFVDHPFLARCGKTGSKLYGKTNAHFSRITRSASPCSKAAPRRPWCCPSAT